MQVWPQNPHHRLIHHVSLQVPVCVSWRMCRKDHVATDTIWPAPRLTHPPPQELSQPWGFSTVRNPDGALALHIQKPNKQVQSHHSDRLCLTKPTVLGMMGTRILLRWEITAQGPALLQSRKICDMRSLVIIRRLLGKPEQGRGQPFHNSFQSN